MENKKNIGKKGIAIGTIVWMIIIVLGFAILLFFFYLVYTQLSWTGRVDKETCHQSVIFRASLPGFAGTKEFVPLKCKTQKICITSGLLGGNCKEFEGSKGIMKVKVKSKEQVEQFIAKEIIDCWEMMGEGKVSIFSQWLAENYGVGSVYPTCVVCNRIAFDNESLGKAGINLDEIDIIKYMATRSVPDKNMSYYNYLSEGKGKISPVLRPKNFEVYDLIAAEGETQGLSISEEGTEISLEDLAKKSPEHELTVMFMQISAPTSSGVFKNTLKTLGFGAGATAILSPKTVIAAVKSKFVWAILVVFGIYQQYSVSQSMGVSAGYCGDVSFGNEAREGCSVVRTVNYNVQEMSNYCSVIESIP